MEQLYLAACRVAAGLPQDKNLVDLATESLADGVDSPSLRELAGLNLKDSREAVDLFQAAVDELGLTWPDRDQALWQVVRDLCARVVDGSAQAGPSARWIWAHVAHEVEQEGDLRGFVALASELEEHPDSREEIEEDIVAAARDLLQRPWPRRWLRLQARLDSTPLSLSLSSGLVPVVPEKLGLGDADATALAQWARQFDATFAANEHAAGFDSQQQAEEFVARGHQLTEIVQRALGDHWQVEYYPEPVRPPGLRLRHPRDRQHDRSRSTGA